MKYIFAFIVLTSLNLPAAISLPTEIKGENLITGLNQTISVKESKEKLMVVIFMSAKCPCSNSHVPLVQKLADQYKEVQFVVVHSNSDEAKKESAEYFKKAGFTVPVIQDDGVKIADQFRAVKTPHAFVMNSEGELLYQGGITDSSNALSASKTYLADALQELSQKKPVTVAQSRTLGCVILRK